jgi:hypothetical protein
MFFWIAEITYDLHILIPLFTITSILFYGFGYSMPFMYAGIIAMNKSLTGAVLIKADTLNNFLLWFAIISLPLNLLMMVLGNAIIGVGISANFGVIIGCIHYFEKSIKSSEQDGGGQPAIRHESK